jgi:DNA-binding MarR family transcriptional regulator
VSTSQAAERLADLTFSLLARCQEKEAWFAEKHRLYQAEFKCLRLFGSDESLNNKQLAKRMNLSPSRLTRIIDGLVYKGYMTKEIDQSDRRNMRIFLSRRGKILTNKLNKAFIDLHSEILQDIDVASTSP